MNDQAPMNWDRKICFRPIGFVQNDYHEPAGPRAMDDVPSRIILDDTLVGALDGLEIGQSILVAVSPGHARPVEIRQLYFGVHQAAFAAVGTGIPHQAQHFSPKQGATGQSDIRVAVAVPVGHRNGHGRLLQIVQPNTSWMEWTCRYRRDTAGLDHRRIGRGRGR